MEKKEITTLKKWRDHVVKEMDYNKSDTGIDDSQVTSKMVKNA
jgi:hypothetical protein